MKLKVNYAFYIFWKSIITWAPLAAPVEETPLNCINIKTPGFYLAPRYSVLARGEALMFKTKTLGGGSA